MEGDVTALRRAAAEADAVKAQGSHVLALGVGAAVTSAASERRLTAISGFDQYPDPEPDFGKADYALVKDIDDLPAALRAFAVALCKGSVAVTKLVDEGDGVFRPDPGWDITADVATSSGSYTWTLPPPATPTGPRTVTTDKDGVANFQWAPDDATASSLVTLTEESRPGYDLVDWTCTKGVPGRTRRAHRPRRRPADRHGDPRSQRVRALHRPQPDPAGHDRDREVGVAAGVRPGLRLRRHRSAGRLHPRR